MLSSCKHIIDFMLNIWYNIIIRIILKEVFRMLRKIAKAICYVFLWLTQVSSWMYIFETWPFFNQVTNETIVTIFSMILAVVSCYGIISFVELALKHN